MDQHSKEKVVFSINITRQDKAILESMAQRNGGSSISAMIRKLIRDAAKRQSEMRQERQTA